MRRYLKYFLILALSFDQATAQLLPFKTYSSKDGLINNHVTAVTRDDLGLLWIGTPFGINWFDGDRFTEPPIKALSGQLYITNFFKDSQKNIWVLSFYNGLYKYQDHRFINFLPNPAIEAISNNVFDMVELGTDDYIIATDQNIFRFNGKAFSLFDPGNNKLYIQFNSIGFIKGRWLFFACSKGVFAYKKEKDHWRFAGQALQQYDIKKLVIEQEQVWIATEKGLLYFDSPEKVVHNNITKTFLKDKLVISIDHNDQTGELWISSDKLYRMKNEEMSSIDLSNGLVAAPGKVYFDHENIAWICTTHGITKLTNEISLFYDLVKGPANSMLTSISRDEKNDLWLGTFEGLVKKTGTGFKAYLSVENSKVGYIAWLHQTKKNVLYAGTAGGIITIQNDRLQIKHKVITTKVYEDEKGILWIGTEHGKLYKMQEDSLTEIIVEPTVPDFIDAIYKDQKENLWIGYRGVGIRKYRLEKDHAKLIKEYSSKNNFQDLRIRCSYTDKQGNIYFGTRTNGVFIISSLNENKTWHFTTNNGLSANWVKSISSDLQGNVYMATNKGVNVLTGSLGDPFIRKLNLFNEDISDASSTVYCENEKLWIGTETGLIEYLPQDEKSKLLPPKIFITQVSINGKADSTLPSYSSSRYKKLAPGNAIISFEFSGIHFIDDAPLQYRYKLEGQDKNWSYAASRNFVSYNLPPGHYTFLAEARNSFGNWSSQPATFSFMIPAPFWKTWWFVSAVTIAACFLVVFFYRYRLGQALKLERLRHRISTDLHDDIGSTLSSISILSDIASKEKDHLQSGNMLQEIKHNSVSLMEKMDDIVWSINPGNDSIEDLMLRIKRFASKLLDAKEIDYSIIIDESISKAKLAMETRQHIYLIMKEAINNLVKYSDCTRACIRVKFDHNYLNIEISDNGKGFHQQKIKFGNGIISMKKRAEAINGQINIDTEVNKGTTISLHTKIK